MINFKKFSRQHSDKEFKFQKKNRMSMNCFGGSSQTQSSRLKDIKEQGSRSPENKSISRRRDKKLASRFEGYLHKLNKKAFNEAMKEKNSSISTRKIRTNAVYPQKAKAKTRQDIGEKLFKKLKKDNTELLHIPVEKKQTLNVILKVWKGQLHDSLKTKYRSLNSPTFNKRKRKAKDLREKEKNKEMAERIKKLKSPLELIPTYNKPKVKAEKERKKFYRSKKRKDTKFVIREINKDYQNLGYKPLNFDSDTHHDGPNLGKYFEFSESEKR